MAQHSETWLLVDKVKQGDRDRFGDLFGRIAPAVHAWAGVRIPSSLRAAIAPEDVVQEVWCRALIKFPTFEAGQRTFRQWIFAIGKNVLMETYRSISKHPRGTGGTGDDPGVVDPNRIPEDCTAISMRVARDHEVAAFSKRIADLPDEDRELLVLRGMEDMPHEQIAESLGVTAAVVRKRWSRLSESLRKDGLPAGIIEPPDGGD